MKIVLATGIYPPEIGGPATYVEALAREFVDAGHEVVVVAYGADRSDAVESGKWKVSFVSRRGGPPARWCRYGSVLNDVAKDADIVEAFSSMSCGVPVMFSDAKKPKKVLRLGGDFFWERYTDRGGMRGLKDWYAGRPWSRFFVQKILRSFDHIVFSTRFEEEMYEEQYALPPHSVIENAVPAGSPVLHHRHEPLRLLFMGRFVGFKNLPALLKAHEGLPEVQLTLVGSGPMEAKLRRLAAGSVTFLPPVSGAEKARVFAEQDLLILPSITELSPHVALEARAAGLPVLLTRATGLSETLTRGMVLADLSTPERITEAVRRVQAEYDAVAQAAASVLPVRGWADISREHLSLFAHL
ncbi:MAG: glycosyltransferase family 4 protein [Candidatus Peribacteraceae bacterium]|nr:glycosyltransferase family 4 protein [Candidatus Peribacteraceae bacterium]